MTTERVAENADNGFVNNGVVKDISAFLHNNKIRSMGGMTFNNTYHGHTHADGYGPCIAALGQTNPRDHREALMRTNAPTEGTCQWILEDEKFQKWNGVTRPQDPLLWISAGTGKGKTTLAIFLSKHLEAMRATNDATWVFYCFCDRQQVRPNTAASILKSLLWQIYQKKENLAEILHEERRTQGDALLSSDAIDALWRIFRDTIEKGGAKRITCIIDGLDHCQEEHLEHFAWMINRYFAEAREIESRDTGIVHGSSSAPNVEENSTTGPPDFRMIVLSQSEPAFVVKHFKDFPSITLDHQPGKNTQSDLKLFIDERKANTMTNNSSQEKKLSEETKTAIVEALDQGENRGFLWTRLVSDMMPLMTQREAKKFAKELPATVNDIYMGVLKQISSRHQSHACALLKWIALSARPMIELELMRAVKYTLRKSFSKKKFRKGLVSCGALLHWTDDDKVLLAHDSIRDMLWSSDSPLLRDKKLKGFVFREAEGHSELANACIAYLETSKTFKKAVRVRLQVNTKLYSSEEKYLKKHPFLEYAIVHWMHHAKYGPVDKTDFGSPFFRDKDPTHRRKLWWQSYLTSMKWLFAWKIFAPTDLNLLHLAAFFDIVPLAQFLESCKDFKKLQRGEDSYGMRPIDRATERTQVAMVKFLLERGDFAEKTLLQAAQTGEAPIMRLLLDNRRKLRGSQVGSPTSDSQNPFNFKVLRKRTLNSISDLSNKVFDADHCSPTSPESPMSPASPISPASPLTPNSPFTRSNTASESPIHVATKGGHLEIVQLLLEYDEDINQTTASKWTALHYAAYFGRLAIAEHLVSSGATCAQRTTELATALHCAVLSEQLDIAALFLRHQIVDVDAEDIFGQTGFHMACKSDNVPLMQLLFDSGATIERRNKIGWTPLMLSCQSGRVNALKFLLKHNADVNSTWAGLGPLEITKKYKPPNATNYDEVVQILEGLGLSQRDESEVNEVQIKLLADPGFGSYDLPQVNDAGPDIEVAATTIDETDVDGVDTSDESDIDSDVGSDSDEGRDSSARNQDGLDAQSHSKKVGLGILDNKQGTKTTKRTLSEDLTAKEEEEICDTQAIAQVSEKGASSAAAGSTPLSGLRESLTNAYRSTPDVTSKAGRSIAKAATSSWSKIRGTKELDSTEEATLKQDVHDEQPSSQGVADASHSHELSDPSIDRGENLMQPANDPPTSDGGTIRRKPLSEKAPASMASPIIVGMKGSDTVSEVSIETTRHDDEILQDAPRRRSDSSLGANALLSKMSFGRKKSLPLSTSAPIPEALGEDTNESGLSQSTRDGQPSSEQSVAKTDVVPAPNGPDEATSATTSRFGKLSFGRKKSAK